jgi:lincosamide nucleotidyltransferase A/C/D/E
MAPDHDPGADAVRTSDQQDAPSLRRRVAAVLSRFELVQRIQTRINTQMTAADVIEVISALERQDLSVRVGGGWGVDALLGARTRRHRDLDLILCDEELEAVSAALSGMGFRERSRQVLEGVVLSVSMTFIDSSGRRVELHPVDLAALSPQRTDGSRATAFDEGVIGGRRVQCLSAPLQLALHDGYDTRYQDRFDLVRLRRLVADRQVASPRLNRSADV